MRKWKTRPATQATLAITIASYLETDPRRLDALKCLLYCFKAQTFQRWVARVVHDGPCDPHVISQIEALDPRIVVVTKPKMGNHGHPHRHPEAMAARIYANGEEKLPDWLLWTNDDNYYMPTFLEWLISEAEMHQADFAYSNMVHSHRLWAPFVTEPVRRRIDMGAFIVKRSLAAQVPWVSHAFDADGTYVEALRQHATKLVKVPAFLFVHN